MLPPDSAFLNHEAGGRLRPHAGAFRGQSALSAFAGEWKKVTTYEPPSGDSSPSSRLRDQPLAKRPREQLMERGAEALSSAELIAILVRTGLPGANAADIGRQLL